ncbi:MAG: alpha/beta hydrolase [Erythrobacter sp.]
MSELRTERIASFDEVELAVHEMGEGKPVVLVHGLFSSANMNWIKFGHAQKLVEAGFRVIMLDLRAHGDSAAPHSSEAYPEGVLSRDLAALVEHYGLTNYDLVGFSLGSRTSARAVIDGLTPRKLVLSGMGLEGLAGWANRAAFFIDAIDRFDEVKRGDPAFMAKSFMKTMDVDRVAARQLLLAVDDTEAEELSAITMPTMVLCGADDRDNGSAPDLAAKLPMGEYTEIPGTHMSSVAEAAMGDALVQFLEG